MIIPAPTINFRHSDEARTTAAEVAKMTKSALYKLGTYDLDGLAIAMGLDPMGKKSWTKKALVESVLPERAAQIIDESREDSRLAYEDPAWRREAFFAKLHAELDGANATYLRYREKAATARDFDWSYGGNMADAAARAQALEIVLRYEGATYRDDHPQAGQPMSLEDVKARITSEVVRRAGSPNRSTSPMSNMLEEAITAHLADTIRDTWF